MAVLGAMPTASCCDVIHEVKSRAAQKDGARCNGQEARLFSFVFCLAPEKTASCELVPTLSEDCNMPAPGSASRCGNFGDSSDIRSHDLCRSLRFCSAAMHCSGAGASKMYVKQTRFECKTCPSCHFFKSQKRETSTLTLFDANSAKAGEKKAEIQTGRIDSGELNSSSVIQSRFDSDSFLGGPGGFPAHIFGTETFLPLPRHWTTCHPPASLGGVPVHRFWRVG